MKSVLLPADNEEMKAGRITHKTKPFIVRLVKGRAQSDRLSRGYAFIHESHRHGLQRGEINENYMVPALLHLEWEHKEGDVSPRLDVSMILRSWVRYDSKESTMSLQWEVHEGDHKDGSIRQHNRRWLGAEMALGDKFFLNYHVPRWFADDPRYVGFHGFLYHRTGELHIYPGLSFDVIPENSPLFKMNRALWRQMDQLQQGDWLDNYRRS